ncbi:MAG: hypothetical protein IJU66_05180 [Oscillospiraceae bacterium]|nr:hypothetical protein [Oscillospiraceae bacterium]
MDYSAANTGLWSFVIQLGLIAGAILLAQFLYRVVKPLRRAMLPVAVLAGFLLLAAKYLGVPLEDEMMEILVFHGIALGFIAMSLRVPMQPRDSEEKLTGLRSGAVIVSTYLVQGAVGLLISLALSRTLTPGLFHAAGMLLPMGYGQGPGQANNVGSAYEALGFAGGRSYGMAIAAAGYLAACTVGVVILNVLKSRGLLTPPAHSASPREQARDFFGAEGESSASTSIDVLSIQAAMVIVVYLATFLVTRALTGALDTFAPGAAATVSPLLWGFNFIIGSALAIALRVLLGKRKTQRPSRALQYQNNYLLGRISGFFFDVMIVAGIASIELEDVRALWLPFLLMTVAGGAVTWLHLRLVCFSAYPDYRYQGLISMFGMLTGTISSGVLLLREVDPELSTPAANNLITGSSFGIILGAPILVLVSLAAKSEAMCLLTLGLVLAYLALLYFVIFRLGKKRKKE